MTDPSATLEITITHPPSSAFQELAIPIIEVDGEQHRGVWGLNTVPVTAGRHTVRAYHRWFFFREAFASETVVEVAEGDVAHLHWHTGAAVTRPGTWRAL